MPLGRVPTDNIPEGSNNPCWEVKQLAVQVVALPQVLELLPKFIYMRKKKRNISINETQDGVRKGTRNAESPLFVQELRR